MNIILTGGAGFIGSCYLKTLNEMGVTQITVVDTESDAGSYANLRGKKFNAYVSRENLRQVLESGKLNQADVIVHMGACTDTTEPNVSYLTANNFEYSKMLASWCLRNGKRFHYASSAALYGDGKEGFDDADAVLGRYTALNPYGHSKWQFDQWLINEKLTSRVTGFRFFNVFGPNEYHKGEMKSMVAKGYEQIQRTGKVRLFASSRAGFEDGSETRDFVYVKDVTSVMRFFLENPPKSGIFNLGTGQPRTFKDLMKALFIAMNLPDQIEYFPMPEKYKAKYQYFTQANITKLRQAGYVKPFMSLEVSVMDYVRNYLSKANPVW